MMELTEATEDYLERISELLSEKGYARVSDMAERLSIKPASVTKMVQKLEQLGYISREPYRGFTLTTLGKSVGKKISRRHQLLSEFFAILGVSKKNMEKDIEGIEHHLSEETVKAIKNFVEKSRRQRKV